MMWRFICLLIPCCGAAQPATPASTEAYFSYVIHTLAHDSMQGRLPGTPAEQKSAHFIARELKQAGCQPLHKKQYLHPFTYVNPDSVLVTSAGNVIAKLETRSKQCVIIGAHYDHIGMGRHHSRAPLSRAIHNGADDNASGVAMLLHLAAWCSKHKKELSYDMIFVAYSGEEDGLWGSKELWKGYTLDTAAIALYLNFDMLGHLNSTTPILKTEGLLEYPELDTLLPPDSLFDFNIRKADPIFTDGSDNYTFEQHHIRGIAFSTGLTEQYHRPEDDATLINYPGMNRIAFYLEQVCKRLQIIDLQP